MTVRPADSWANSPLGGVKIYFSACWLFITRDFCECGLLEMSLIQRLILTILKFHTAPVPMTVASKQNSLYLREMSFCQGASKMGDSGRENAGNAQIRSAALTETLSLRFSPQMSVDLSSVFFWRFLFLNSSICSFFLFENGRKRGTFEESVTTPFPSNFHVRVCLKDIALEERNLFKQCKGHCPILKMSF